MSSPAEFEVDAVEAARRAEAGAPVLDVREPDEWEAGRIAESTHIPIDQLAARQDEVATDGTIVVVCRSGARSARVTAELVAAGYDAVNLAGGLHAWVDAGYPLTADGGAPGTVA
ncbi:MAG: rhodanese-like domain-containing protein [Acidimicrobiia bacterium]